MCKICNSPGGFNTGGNVFGTVAGWLEKDAKLANPSVSEHSQ